MPRNRKAWKEPPPHINAAHRALVKALREVRECSPRTQAAIAREANQEPTTLSNHLNGGRIPDESLLRDFYAVVEKDAAATGDGPLPHSLDALLELRTRAKKKHCDCCTVGHPAATEDSAAQQQPASPAAANPELARTRRLRQHVRRRVFSQRPKPGGVPVPPREGDRHPADAVELTWPEAETIAAYLADGRNHDASFLLWQAGTSYAAADIVSAVTSCRIAGLNDAAEAILINVAERTDRQAVLNVAAALGAAGRHEDVTFILAAAMRPAP
ncbi:hypothetical protein MHW47_08815 [Streptomyces sp. OfavH-34-F]|uniref:hypothetical protein n=1 Tax=Streptomyces sp. OfavH-34-F TaxID=2917760 RepID=UPI001EF1ABE1|nr:hypothetical protein [Streptomyces sp. OfavH-34-F]MCG7524535.1 hypothetical protein [Streptomyces sp. OfavH-34-F]